MGGGAGPLGGPTGPEPGRGVRVSCPWMGWGTGTVPWICTVVACTGESVVSQCERLVQRCTLTVLADAGA